uniref:Uncharacterized protein n=1 Tax=Populus trichocarpa TaxID=3694 RepID=A0A3N7GGF0_POPTR
MPRFLITRPCFLPVSLLPRARRNPNAGTHEN